MADRGKRQREDWGEDSVEARRRRRQEESCKALEQLESAQEMVRSIEMSYRECPEDLFDDFEGFDPEWKQRYLDLLLESWDKLSPEQQEKHKGIGPRYVLEMALQQVDNKARESKVRMVLEKYPALLFESWECIHNKVKGEEWLDGIYRACWYKLTPEEQQQYKEFRPQHGIKLTTAASRAFDMEYEGSGVDSLYDALNKIKEETDFSRVVGLFQSSGWGKSRVVRELHRKQVWVIYLSLGSGSCYPQPSYFRNAFLGRVRQALGNGDYAGHLACMTYCLAYWIACIEELGEGLGKEEPWTPQVFANMMTVDGGKDFWPGVENRIEKLEQELQSLQKIKASTQMELWTTWETKATQVFNRYIREVPALEIGTETTGQPLKLLFVFDEARSLLPSKDGREENVYIPLQRSTRVLGGTCLTLFIDTTSRVTSFLEPEWCDPSAWSRNRCFLPSPLVAFFKGDIGENSTRLPATSTQGNCFEEVVSNEWMLKYGRPLWWSLYLSNLATDPAMDASESCQDPHRWLESATDADKAEAFQTVFGIAQYKLTLVTTRDITRYSEHARIAMLGVRYGIFIDPSSKLVEDLIASHMLTALYVTSGRARLFATWVAEPLLSEAALVCIQQFKETPDGYRLLFEPLQALLSAGIVDKGEQGELLLRIILLEAVDKAREMTGEKRSWCTVDEFFSQLVKMPLSELAQQEKMPHQEKVRAVAQGKISINCFRRIYKDKTDLSDLVEAFKRRCGIVCYRGAWGVDILVPIHLGDMKDRLKLSALFIQAKDMKRSSGLIALAKNSPQFSGLGCLDESPYLSLHMDLNSGSGNANKVDMVAPERVWKAVSLSKEAQKAVQQLGSKVHEIRKRLERENQGGCPMSRRNEGAAQEQALLALCDSCIVVQSERESGSQLTPEQEQSERELGPEWIAVLETPINPEQHKGKNPAQQEQSQGGKEVVIQRWKEWMTADIKNQIIVKTRGLDCLSLDADFLKILEDIKNVQVRPQKIVKIIPEDGAKRYQAIKQVWEVQDPLLQDMFGILNINDLTLK
ncbi:uncharacterized protein LOC9663046 isoform X2 [Selaginella moellendorffii]|uniref:uncharacterized protein LOC9663046 isoform X2 n=1 Tax=Selaginella moellendorffii TaxID=88036 RepID=UPI000D1C44C8|nr:uncharacterized protein LOC9663046 isoform X2 [Selaginella moellendorffii]|eukprot:XP_024517099.1 uncharacterized protein LOC9663046 isoform X2 [Selaginella moellendorffii]